MQAQGGSELAVKSLLRHAGVDWTNEINLIVSYCSPELINPRKINVIWQQLSYDQDAVQLMTDPAFVNSVDYFVYVSHWNYEKFRNMYNIPEHKSLIIKNATDKFGITQKPQTHKLKLIYTSTPWRGLDVLLDAFELLDRSDIELDIYSSTIIYGDEFHQRANEKYRPLFDRAKSMPNVNYMGYSSNEGVRRALQTAHIFSYPSTFEETSCMSAIEAAASGCQLVTTNYGALYETCGEWSTYVPYTSNHKQLAVDYAATLNQCIDNFWTDQTQNKLKAQVEFYDRFWSWDVRAPEWRNFFDRISNKKT